MNNNQNFVATLFNAMFPLLNTAQVYVSGIYMPKEMTAKAFLEAFRECRINLEKGPEYDLEPEYYLEQFKHWAKKGEEIIFTSLMTYHPEKFYPQQIEDMPVDEDFWWGMFQKELWETYQHDLWSQEREYISKEMWESN